MHLLRANPNRGRACHSNDNLRMRLPFTRNPDALAGCDQPANSLAIQTQHPGPPLPSKKDEAPSFAHSTLPLCRPPRPPGKSPSRTACTRHRPVTLVFWGGSQRGKVECRHRAERYLRGFRLSCGRYLGSSLHPPLAGATRAPRSPAVSQRPPASIRRTTATRGIVPLSRSWPAAVTWDGIRASLGRPLGIHATAAQPPSPHPPPTQAALRAARGGPLRHRASPRPFLATCPHTEPRHTATLATCG